jgi:hypothetical protein
MVRAREMFSVDYVPETHAFEPIVVSLRLAFEIATSGSTLWATGSMEVRDGNANIIAGPFGADSLSGVRLVPAIA